MDSDLKILCKKMNIFNDTYNKFEEANRIDEDIFKECICDILSWMEICIKKINDFESEEMGIISAIRYVNNLKKHSLSIFKYTLESYCFYPCEDLYPGPDLYPLSFNVWWNELPLDQEKFIKQYENLNKYLKNKELYKSLNNIFEIINKHYN